MQVTFGSWRRMLALLAVALTPAAALSQDSTRAPGDNFPGQRSRQGLREPVLRVAEVPKRTSEESPVAAPATPATNTSTNLPGASSNGPAPQAHVLDPVLAMAYRGLGEMDRNIKDYTATLVKRERINGRLGEYQYSFMKVRNEPLSVYMYFLGPDKMKGQEVVFVTGRNLSKEGKAQLCGHAGSGIKALVPRMWLDPDSAMAMEGQKYSINKVGIRNLIKELIEVGEKTWPVLMRSA